MKIQSLLSLFKPFQNEDTFFPGWPIKDFEDCTDNIAEYIKYLLTKSYDFISTNALVVQ